MSFDDDSTDDSAGFRPPPHPDDRLWRHPSELDGQRRRRVRPARPAATYSPWGTVAVAAAGVTLVAAGAGVAALGLRDQGPVSGSLSQAVTSPFDGERGQLSEYAFANLNEANAAQVEVARELAPSVVRVDAGARRGSGVIIRDDGLVLTSSAVVGDLRDVAVALGDGRLLTATTLGTDPLTGLALLDLPGSGYAATVLTDVPPSEILGEPGLAFGVDELGRMVLGAGDVAPTPMRVTGQERLDGMLVVETVVDPVAQGGPVVDEVGTVIGLTIWTDEVQTYATPVTVVRKVVDDILEAGAVQHVWLGITGSDASDYGWPAGVRIASVPPSGPAAGLLSPGDVIVAINQQLVSHLPALVAELRRHDPGDVVQLSYRRTGYDAALTQPVVLALRPQTLDI